MPRVTEMVTDVPEARPRGGTPSHAWDPSTQQLAGSLEFVNDTDREQLVACTLSMAGLVLRPGQPAGQSTVKLTALEDTHVWCETSDQYGIAIVEVDGAKTLGGTVKLGSWMRGSWVGSHGIVAEGTTARGQLIPFGSTIGLERVEGIPAAELRIRFLIGPRQTGHFTWNASFAEPAQRS